MAVLLTISPQLGTTGADLLLGTVLADSIRGNDGNDTLLGGLSLTDPGDGSDTLRGEAGNDRLVGGLDTDFLYGSAGLDTLDGGANDDLLAGDSEDDAEDAGDDDDITGDDKHGWAFLWVWAGGNALPSAPISAGATAS